MDYSNRGFWLLIVSIFSQMDYENGLFQMRILATSFILEADLHVLCWFPPQLRYYALFLSKYNFNYAREIMSELERYIPNIKKSRLLFGRYS
jgi:hypothetical protein